MQPVAVAGLRTPEPHVVLQLANCGMLNEPPQLLHLVSATLHQITRFFGRTSLAQSNQGKHRWPPSCWWAPEVLPQGGYRSCIFISGFESKAEMLLQFCRRCHRLSSSPSCIVQPLRFEGVQRFAGSGFSHVATLLSVTEAACAACRLYRAL